LSVSRGAVYGLVGANGAGKTTLIRHVLGLLRPESGSVRVFGRDPIADPVAVLSRIGYLSEENDLPAWMRVGELIRYSRAFYPAWDDAYAEELRQAFALDPTAKIKTLSRGQKAERDLLVALAHRPELLVLDERRPGSSHCSPRHSRCIMRAIAHEAAGALSCTCWRKSASRRSRHHDRKRRDRSQCAAGRHQESPRRRTPALPPEIFVARVGRRCVLPPPSPGSSDDAIAGD
jgi:ABC-2 type transport system ATP-binding protein